MRKIGIIGGGASGLFCAAYLAYYTSFSITIYEKNNRVGKKLLLTGNGKCNLSNMNMQKNFYNHPQALDIIAQFDVQKTCSFFQQLGLLTKVDAEGRIYPYSETATSVLETLRQFLLSKQVKMICDYPILDIEKKGNQFYLKSNNHSIEKVDIVILASGGLAYYQKSNTYALLKALGHTYQPLYPSLTGFKVKEKLDSIANLRCKAQVSLWNNQQCIVKDYGEVFFKKDGLSGIVIFQMSSYYHRVPSFTNMQIQLDLMPDYDKQTLFQILNQKKAFQENVLQGILPKMLAEYVYKQALTKDISSIIQTIKHLTFHIEGTDSFDHAQMTAGGVPLDEIDLSSMESKKIPSLYLIGELVDIDGICGGYNLQWAWSSGAVCAMHLRKEEANEKTNKETKKE